MRDPKNDGADPMLEFVRADAGCSGEAAGAVRGAHERGTLRRVDTPRKRKPGRHEIVTVPDRPNAPESTRTIAERGREDAGACCSDGMRLGAKNGTAAVERAASQDAVGARSMALRQRPSDPRRPPDTPSAAGNREAPTAADRPRSRVRWNSINWTPEFVRPIATAIAAGFAHTADRRDPPPVGRDLLIGARGWSKDRGRVEAELRGQPRVSYASVLCGTDVVPPRERRAFVPSAQGNGLRYNWRVSRARSWDDLFKQVEDAQATSGYRISHIANSGPGLSFLNAAAAADPPAAFDIVWTCDDEANYLWGVSRFDPVMIHVVVEAMRAGGRRPICLVNTGNQQLTGEFCLVWIQDQKYEGPLDWKIVTSLWGALQDRLDLERVAGYRPITATSWSGVTTLVMVRDGVETFPHEVRLYFSLALDTAFDPIAAFRAEFPFFPACVECKAYVVTTPGEHVPLVGQEVNQLWTVLGIDSPDIESNVGKYGMPKAWSWSFSDELPSATEVDGLKNEQQRIPAVASFWDPEATTSLRVLSMRCRYSDRHFRAISCISDANPEEWETEWETEEINPDNPGLPAQPFVAWLDALVYEYMAAYKVTALTLAVQDAGNAWKLRRGYTYAPWEFEDTYPDSQFRVGSISKALTAIATNLAVQQGLTTLNQPIFNILPAEFTPAAGGNNAYPATVLNVQVQHLLGHTAGWADSRFDPNNHHDRIVESTGNAGVAMAGWKSLNGVGLRPMVRDDSQRYMLREAVFSLNPVFVPGANTATLQLVTGWNPGLGPTTPYVPGSMDDYSGYGYDLLGLVLEYVTGDPSGPRDGYENYAAWTKANLFVPLGMTATVRGRSARSRAERAEVCYPEWEAPPAELEEPLVHSMPFTATQLYTALPGPGGDWYPGDDIPPDFFIAPAYSNWNYGGVARVEPFTPGGSWVSTAPDLCRLFAVYLPGEGTPLTNATIQSMLQGDTTPDATGWLGACFCWVTANTMTSRRVGMCSNMWQSGKSPLFGAVLNLMAWAGV